MVKWAREQDHPPPAVHIDMRSSHLTQVYSRKGWGTRLWVGLQGAIRGILPLRSYPGGKNVESLLRIMQGQGHGKPGEGVCKVYPVDNPLTIIWGCDMIALQQFSIPKKEDLSTLPFRWQISQQNRWDDLAVTPTHSGVALEHPLSDLNTSSVYTTKSQAWYQAWDSTTP